MKIFVMAALVLAGLWMSVGPALAELPIFDAHIHFSQPDWDVYTPERALSILARARVKGARQQQIIAVGCAYMRSSLSPRIT